MKLAWLTDIHLNFLDPAAVEAFFLSLAESTVDGILLSGDIGEADDVAIHLNALDTAFQVAVTSANLAFSPFPASGKFWRWMPRSNSRTMCRRGGSASIG